MLRSFHAALTSIKNLGDNDIYRWYLASIGASDEKSMDLKLNLIYPCTEQHIRKYSPQGIRMVTETPEIYKSHIQPYMRKKRDEGRLNWVFNIIEGRTEQEDVILRDQGQGLSDDAFLILPDLNWDRKTLTSLHLLGLVERRDIWSLRDLKKSQVPWLKHMREKILDATVGLYKEIERDQLKLYVHCTMFSMYPILDGYGMLRDLQTSLPITISTSTSSTFSSKQATPSPWEKHSGSKISSPSSRP